jgi:copper(I)-binding protein
MGDDEMGDDEMDEGMSDDGDESGMEGMGAMTMQEVEAIELGAGDTVNLEPGGYHIMLLDLVEPLEVGDTFDVTLDFETADDLVVTVEVRDSAP